MEVTVFRHGIAVDRADPQAPVDFERPLTLEGKNRTEGAARGLRAIITPPSIILTSPLRRCVQSARLIASAFGIQRKFICEVDELRPDAAPDALWPHLALLARPTVLCVGHGGSIEPTVGVALGLAASPAPTTHAAPGDAPDDAIYRTLHLKKAGALHLDVSLEPVLRARLVWLLSPKILRQLGRA